ncbi:DNA invertase Pin-like site-specific DNA recombinase [Ruminiclostridium sufflavum DSM 19573]|uniref:DNA invertase Pin-like site-specific DNA recombinase n=1 Tax=Ruminiclostridium sufflavum DSM 19573 TaxID=1121337 RepID=A0A318XP96_9FIRM|nr:recombinase family protein [Ruminiclostridium sufflavum]PYG88873.1 DNA invertase Pin-like site-specific DNA recombinase [Ruminiclostridium sufflavum DSM 19573]
MIKTCIYLRKSREDEKIEKELGRGETLAKHRKDLLSFANAKKLTIIKIYEELVSGESLLYRPAMLELLKGVQNGLYDAVLVMDLQRLGRGDMEEQGIILKAFKNTDTKIITPDKTYDLSNEFDEEYSEFEAFMSRKEYKMITKRLQRGVIHSVKSGNYNSPYAPFGYIIKEEKFSRTLEPHPEQADIVKSIFDWYVNESAGSQIIAERLNNMGIKTNKNNIWTCWAVSGLLKNPVYTGKIVWGKTLNYRTCQKKNASRKQSKEKWIISEGKHPPLISYEIFERAELIMQKNTKSPVKPATSLSNPLAGILICGVCGSKMQYRPYQESSAHVICRNKCGNKSSKFEYVEAEILSALQEYLDGYSFDITKKTQGTDSEEAALKSSIGLLKKQLSEAYIQKDNIYVLLEKGVYSIDIFTERADAVFRKIDALTQKLDKTSAIYQNTLDNKQLLKTDFIPHAAKVISEYYNLETPENKNLLLKSVLEKVEYIKGKGCRNDNFGIRIYPLL